MYLTNTGADILLANVWTVGCHTFLHWKKMVAIGLTNELFIDFF
jgi:hypothetical protein